MKQLLGYMIEKFDLTLWMRFAITLILLYMLYQAMFGTEPGSNIDAAWKNVLVLLVGTSVGYFFATSKGSTDKQEALLVPRGPLVGTVTTTTQVEPKPTTVVTTETNEPLAPTTTTITTPKVDP